MTDDAIHVTYYPHRDTAFTPMPRALRLDSKISKNAKLLYLDLVALAQEQPIGKELTIARADLAKMEGTSAREITRNIRDLKAGHWLGVQKRYRLDQFKKAHQDVNGYAVFAEQADCENWALDNCPIFISHDGQPCPSSKERAFTPMGVHEGQGCPPELNTKTRDSSLFTNVHKEESLAQPSQAQVDAGHFSGKKEEAVKLYELRELLKHGHVFAEYYDPTVIQALLDLGEIERCVIDDRSALCLKGKCPQSHTDCNDPKVAELQTAIQTAFLPGSNGNQPETVAIPSPQTPLPPPAPAALPEVPEGYDVVFSSSFRHYVGTRGEGKMTVCHFNISKNGYRRLSEFSPAETMPIFRQCPECAAKAAARPATAKKATMKQPSTDVKDALALLRHGGKEHMTGANWSALVKLWNQLECPPLDKIQKFAKWWAQDWRGKQGERPAHAIIVSEWPTAMQWKDSNTEPVMHYADDGEDFPEVHLDDPV